MRTSTWNIAVVGAVVAISALLAVWIAMLGGYIVDQPIDSEWFETDTEDPQQDPPDTPPTDVQDKGGEQVLVPEPIETVDPEEPVPGSDDQPLDIEELKRLAELEGKQDFSKAYYSPYDY